MHNFDIFGTKEIIQNKLPIAFTFGNFDGVHLGHQSLISAMLKASPQPIVVMVFDPHPANFFKPDEPKKFITTIQDKVNLLLQCGVDAVIVQKFSTEFSLMSADEFCTDFLAKYFNIRHVFLGYNLSYGKDRIGDFFHMQKFGKKLGWDAIQLPALEDAPGQIISSTRIRSAILDAQPILAEKLLSRAFSISGTVFHGDGRGRQLGFPTANIDFDKDILIPQYGVYACEVELPIKYPNKRFFGVMNCGIRPTIFANGPRVQIETYILDFDDDVYGEYATFHLKHFIRKEQKFGNIALLKEQMQKDVSFARNIFGHIV